MARSAVLSKPNVANIPLFNFCEQKFLQHGPIIMAIDCNGLSLLIFEKKSPNYAPEPKSAPNINSFWVLRWNFSMYACGFSIFCALNATILLVYIPAKIKMSFIWKDDFFAKIGIFCNSISHNISQQCLSVYTTIFVRPKDKPNFCQIRHELNVAIHEMRLVEKKKTLGDWQTLLLFLVTKASQVIMKRLMTQQLYKLWKFIKNKNEWRSNKCEVLNIWEC